MTFGVVTYNTWYREIYVTVTPGLAYIEMKIMITEGFHLYVHLCLFFFFFLFIFYFFTFFPPFLLIFFSFKGEGLEEENRVSNNLVIGLSGTDGLSNIETLSPAGIYIRAPASHIRVRSSGIRHNISFLIKGIRKTQSFIYLGDRIHDICFLAELSQPVLVMGY